MNTNPTQSLAAILNKELKKVASAVALAVGIAGLAYSLGYMKLSVSQATQQVFNQSKSIVVTGLTEGNNFYFESELNRFLRTWQDSQFLIGRVDLILNGKLIAHAGPTDPFRFLSVENSRIESLPSGATLKTVVQINETKFLLLVVLSVVLLESILGLIFLLAARRIQIFVRRFTGPLSRTVDQIKAIASNLPVSAREEIHSDPLDVSEVSHLAASVNGLRQEILTLESSLLGANLDRARLEVAEQMAHDIRSPLATLDMTINHLGGLSREDTTLLRREVNRLREIVSDLPKVRTVTANYSVLEKPTEYSTKPELISSLIERMTTEKRIQYQNQTYIRIESPEVSEASLCFSKVVASDFLRILSNLIDNSVESISDSGSGLVKVEIAADSASVRINVVDTGTGIAGDILPVLGVKGATFGKVNGSGLGLYHAKSCIEAWGGELKISSTFGQGTVVSLCLPRVQSPSWFQADLSIPEGTTVAVIDDDPSIGALWKLRLRGEHWDRQGNKLHYFSSPREFAEWYRATGISISSLLCLFDLELRDPNTDGLGMIDAFDLSKNSVLVTSRYADTDVESRCETLQVSRLPKELAGFIPVHLIQSSNKASGEAIRHTLKYANS